MPWKTGSSDVMAHCAQLIAFPVWSICTPSKAPAEVHPWMLEGSQCRRLGRRSASLPARSYIFQCAQQAPWLRQAGRAGSLQQTAEQRGGMHAHVVPVAVPHPVLVLVVGTAVVDHNVAHRTAGGRGRRSRGGCRRCSHQASLAGRPRAVEWWAMHRPGLGGRPAGHDAPKARRQTT